MNADGSPLIPGKGPVRKRIPSNLIPEPMSIFNRRAGFTQAIEHAVGDLLVIEESRAKAQDGLGFFRPGDRRRGVRITLYPV